MIAAQAAARAHHLKTVEHDRISREESFRRSQLMLHGEGESQREAVAEEEPILVPNHLLGVPLKDRDYEEQEEQEAQTFLVVAKKFGKQCVYRFHASKSLYIFSPSNRLRRFVIFLITHQYFEIIILLTILTNCVFLAINNPPEEPEFVFAAIYTAEMVLKIIGRGFALHKYAYLRNAWNWLDFSVVVLGYVTMLPGVANLSGMRTFRVLRALRTISSVKGLKAMVNTLLKSIMMLSDVLILTTFFLCVFALIGLQFFAGIMTQRCVIDGFNASHNITYDEYRTTESNHYIFPGDGFAVLCGNETPALLCPVNYTCLPDTGPNPISEFISYQDFGWSLLTSIQLVTMDYWEAIFNSVIAVKGPLYVFYFLFVIFLGPFYLINLVLAVVSLSYEIETANMQDDALREAAFAKLKKSASTYSFDGKSPVEPMFEVDVLPNMPPEEVASEHFTADTSSHNVIDDLDSVDLTRTQWFRRQVKKLVCNSIFETFITLCILFNTLAMALEHHKMDRSFSSVLEVFNYIFTTVFFFEMVLKLTAFGLKEYCKNNWNLFDGTIVILSLADMVLTHSGAISGAGLSVLRTFRLLRVLKLAQSWKTMGALLNTIGKSIGAVGNIVVILGIIVYMFAVVGMQMFQVHYTADKFKTGKIPRWNFDDFGHSFMMIFRILCGKWIEPLWDTMSAIGGPAVVFVLPAFVIGNFIILNLFLALLLNSFGGDLGSDEEVEDEDKKKEEGSDKEEKKEKKSRLSQLFGKKVGSGSSISKVGPDDEDNENSEMLRAEEEDENENKKEAANNLNSNEEVNVENGFEMKDINKGDDENVPISKSNSIQNENCKSLTTMVDVDRAAIRIREQPNPSKKSDDKLESNEENLSNGDLVANGSAPVVPNGNSRLSASSDRSRKDVSLGDIESRIPAGSPNHDGKRDTIVTVDSEIATTENTVLDCCPSFCYCESVCCESYRDSCIRRAWHALRYNILCFVEHKYFELFILVMIGVSSLTLAFEDIHISKKPILKGIIDFLNYTFAVTFTVEMMLKLLAFGIVGYFNNLWNCLDSLIVAISLASISGNENLNAFRSLRALRPLRAISRFEGMKIVVNSLVHAVPAISNVLLVCMIFWLIFAIIGYQLFSGKFYKCVDSNMVKYDYLVVPNRTVCESPEFKDVGARWMNSKVNFDNSLNGFLALFQVATLEGVFEVMYDSVDSVAVDQQPIYEYSFAAYFYYVIFIIMGAFFFLNLFIGVIIDNFNRLKQEYEDSGSLGFLLTPGQRSWVNTIKKTYFRKPKKQPKRPMSKWRNWIFNLIHQKKFEVFIMTVIMLNMLSMMLQHHNQSQEFSMALNFGLTGLTRYLNYLFTGIFTLEAIIRLIALRTDYFKQAWNVFDFVIVIFSIVGIIMDDVLKKKMSFSPGLLRVARVFRIGRLLRFFEGAKGVRRLLFALVKSLPGLVNIATLLFLIIFIYAIIGMSSFAYVKKMNGITDVVNFETFGNSMLLLFRIGTAAGWNTILDPMMVQPPDCNPEQTPPGPKMNGNCGNPVLAVIYFVSYILFIFLIIINMYIAVILENFNEAQSQEEIGITDDDLETFICVWEKYDNKATHFIYYYQLSDFLDELDEPMRIAKPNRDKLGSLEVPLKSNNRIYCQDLMQALIRRTIGDLEGVQHEEMGGLMQRLTDKFKTKSSKDEETVNQIFEYHAHENKMAAVIQKAYRIHLLKRKIREHCHTKFHNYDRLVENKEKDKHGHGHGHGHGHSWKEKQLHDKPESTAGLETVVAMLWYNESKRHEVERQAAAAEKRKKSQEKLDAEASLGEPRIDVEPHDERQRDSKTSNC